MTRKIKPLNNNPNDAAFRRLMGLSVLLLMMIELSNNKGAINRDGKRVKSVMSK